jgi:hypothetical protein
MNLHESGESRESQDKSKRRKLKRRERERVNKRRELDVGIKQEFAPRIS